jgi:molybdate transport system substrate-binding protein
VRTIYKIVVLVCLMSATNCAQAQTLRVAAAADLQFAMKDLASRYEKQSGVKIAVTYGSSGNLRTQIENGAPFDLFFSADISYPKQLVSKGLADEQSLYVYAYGRLVLWARGDEKLGFAKDGLSALNDPRVKRIAIANPEHAPYGKAAVATLQKAGLYDQVISKLVYGENISQAAQFVESGNAEAGILALSLTFADSMRGGERWEVPADYYPALEQAAVLINASANKAAARAFLEYLKGVEARELLAKYGFSLSARVKKP